LDALAGAIAYKHVDNSAEDPPVTIVTASVDRLDLLLPNQPEDLRLSGHVAYVGKSSMESAYILDLLDLLHNPSQDQLLTLIS
jgi:acyl-coenzyme A thioesterase 9